VSGNARVRRALDGVLLLDKPAGITSQAAVSRAKRALGAAKVGHTGTLDPLATGLLPLTFGEATKFSQTLLDADKAYLATVRLGVTTTTGDLEGDVLRTAPVDVDRSQVEAALNPFRGEIVQIPPMYSALKHAGKPLYEYARAGTEVPRAPRRVTVRSLALEGFATPDFSIRVVCSKGTYIRVLGEDIGQALGCGATLAALRRTHVGDFSLDAAIALDALEAMQPTERLRWLLPVDALLAALPSLELGADDARRIAQGQAVRCPGKLLGLVRLYGTGQGFLGVAEASDAGDLVPRRLVSTAPAKA
jgi:tRNA pseudouridine55 synthase